MNNKKMVPAVAVFALFACAGVQAADKPCARPDIANAQRAIDKVVSWSQLRKAYGDFKQCDSGDVADQFTDALLRMMVEWKNVDELASAMNKDAEYKAFVVKHLQSPAAKDDQPTVYARAKKECPKTLDSFCSDLAEAVKPGAKSGSSNTAGSGDIGIQPMMEPLRIETVKPAAKPDAAKPDAK